jgi:hypothetical protein
VSENEIEIQIGESSYKRFRRILEVLPEWERENFTSRIISHFEKMYPLEFRDVMEIERIASINKIVAERDSNG